MQKEKAYAISNCGRIIFESINRLKRDTLSWAQARIERDHSRIDAKNLYRDTTGYLKKYSYELVVLDIAFRPWNSGH